MTYTNLPRLIIFASGSKDGGGSGFENLVRKSQEGILKAKIVAAVSNYPNGGVAHKANNLGINFEYFSAPWTADKYQEIIKKYQADYIACSGWLKLITGLDSRKTFNIHPGPLPLFGGPGMYGHHVHEAVMESYKRGEVTHSAVCMHFVTEKYDEGPIFFRRWVEIKPNDTAEALGKRVNAVEHEYQPLITNLVVSGLISWDGKNRKTLSVPKYYQIDQQ